MNRQKNHNCRDYAASDKTREITAAADKLARFHRLSWKEAFGKIASPAFRLHRYRNAHSRLLQDALSKLDCTDSGRC